MSLDTLWERMRARSRRLQLADQTDDQTHTHHALVTVLLFGTMGVGLAMFAGGITGIRPSIERGLEVGIVGGWLFYLGREMWNRRRDWRYKTWDGICDVLIPLWVSAPVVFESIKLLWVLSAAVALAYFVFRPVKP